MKKFILPLIFVSLILPDCRKKEEPPEPEPEPAPAPTSGPISGKVYRLDQFGNSYTTAVTDAGVSLESESKQSVTDNNGKYTINNVSAGSHTLVFAKSGCGSIKMQSIIYKIGDTISYSASLADIPSFTVTSARIKDTTWFATKIPGIYYAAQSTATHSNASTIAIISKDVNGTITDPKSYVNYAPVSKISASLDYNRFISYSFLKDNYEIVKGDIIYIKIYPVAAAQSFYIDAKLSKPVYTAFGAMFPQTFTVSIP